MAEERPAALCERCGVACTSRLREVEWYTEALAALGFADIRVIPGAFDVVVATRAS